MNVYVKKGLLLLLSFQFCVQVNAQSVAHDLAKNIAVNFLAAKKESNAKTNVVSNEHTLYSSSGEALVYIFNFEGGGFVIVSADKSAEPVLAYSPTNSFLMDGINEAATDIVNAYAADISYAKKMKIDVEPALKNKWEKAEMGDFSVKGHKSTVVGPLLTSTWNQDKYYNTLCPDEANSTGGTQMYDFRVPNGCVALAMAQIMYYYRYPQKGYGVSNYNCPGYGRLSADYTTGYDYDAMSDNATGFSNDIAKLCYHAGVSIKMNYNADGSGAQSQDVPMALSNRFLYKTGTLYSKESVSNAQWIAYLKTDLDKAMPVYYSACNNAGGVHGCHAFVCDGYDDRGTTDMFHFNFGWGGSKNGFYTLSTIGDRNNPSEAYILRNNIIVGLTPQTEVTKKTGNDTLRATYGSFSDGSSPRTDYENNSDRSWLISPQEGRNITKITLSTSYFFTEANNDVVTIYRGNTANPSEIVAELSGNVDTTIHIQASEVFVTFKSNGSVTAQGFKFTYTSVINSTMQQCIGSRPAPSSANTALSGTITVNGYDAEKECFWALKPNYRNFAIIFTQFDLEEGDFVEINKWNGTSSLLTVKYATHKVNRFTKANPPDLGKRYRVDDVAALICFRADNKLNGTGFSLDWEVDEGVNEPQAGIEALSVYPNPANDRIKVQIETAQPETVQITVYDIVGRVLTQIPASEATQQFVHDIDVSHLAKGVYMLKVATSKGQVMRKVVIQ